MEDLCFHNVSMLLVNKIIPLRHCWGIREKWGGRIESQVMARKYGGVNLIVRQRKFRCFGQYQWEYWEKLEGSIQKPGKVVWDMVWKGWVLLKICHQTGKSRRKLSYIQPRRNGIKRTFNEDDYSCLILGALWTVCEWTHVVPLSYWTTLHGAELLWPFCMVLSVWSVHR